MSKLQQIIPGSNRNLSSSILFDSIIYCQVELTKMPKRSLIDKELTLEVCREIDAHIRKTGITDAQAARDLGVRKQMIQPYRLGKTLPGTQALARACVIWGLKFEYQGMTISAASFSGGEPKIVSRPQQLELPLDRTLEFSGVSPAVGELEMVVLFKKVS